MFVDALGRLNLHRLVAYEAVKQEGTLQIREQVAQPLGRAPVDVRSYPYPAISNGNAVVDFTRSMLNRELTFLSGTAAISRL